MRKTKIICTLGPACDDEAVLRGMVEAGMDVARLNFSHGTHEDHQIRIDRLKKIREEMEKPIALLLDTKGPEYRIRTFENGSVTIAEGAKFTFTTEEVVGNETMVTVNYKDLIKDLSIGDTILVNNGLVAFRVDELEGNNAVCTCTIGGVLSNQKSMNFPNHVMTHDFLSEQDKADLLFGIQNDFDFVAASFVSCKHDLQDLRDFLDANGGQDIELIAKIENRAGVENIDEICELADGVMVARGDLGVEIPFMEVPAIQKFLIDKCRLLGRRVITATEMLETMITNPRPTRAEISDVANAVYDGSSAVMLSGETAAGKYPVESVRNMSDIARFTEEHIDYRQRFNSTEFQIQNTLDAISHSTCSMAMDVLAKAIIVNSLSGQTARMVSRFRAPIDIIGTTTDEKVWRKLNLSWGVTPVLTEEYDSAEVMFYNTAKDAKRVLGLSRGDQVVITGGHTLGRHGSTNMIRISEIK